MIKISKEEAKKLNKMGIKYGENGITKTNNHHHPHYYLCESYYNMKKINMLRNNPVKHKK